MNSDSIAQSNLTSIIIVPLPESGSFERVFDKLEKNKMEKKITFSFFVATTKQKTQPILLKYLQSLIDKETPGVTVTPEEVKLR